LLGHPQKRGGGGGGGGSLACVKRARGTSRQGKMTLQLSIQFKWENKSM